MKSISLIAEPGEHFAAMSILAPVQRPFRNTCLWNDLYKQFELCFWSRNIYFIWILIYNLFSCTFLHQATSFHENPIVFWHSDWPKFKSCAMKIPVFAEISGHKSSACDTCHFWQIPVLVKMRIYIAFYVF